MPQDYIAERHAASVVAIGPSGTNTPQRPSQEHGLKSTIPIPLVEVRTEIMSFEIGEDIFDDEGASQGQLQVGIAATVIDCAKERCGRSKQAIEPTVNWIINRFHVSDTAVMIDGEVGYVARSTTDAVEHSAPMIRDGRLLVMTGLEVVKKVEL